MNEKFPFQPDEPIDVEYTTQEDDKRILHTPPPLPPIKKKTARLNILLFLATLCTTTLAGAMMEVENANLILPQFYRGLPFSITLLTILLFHEFGHYFMAKRHKVDVTLPYFIPAPSMIGTFGAVIKMRSPLYSKRSLLDIGAAGPFAGVIVAIPATIIGLKLSEIRPLPENIQDGISLGSSLLFNLLASVSVGTIPEHYDLFLHPIAFAGWIGLLVTMLNLIPIGQLDGGHIAYAVFGQQLHRRIAYVLLPLLFVLGIVAWQGWLVWCVLLFFVMGIKHPPTLDEYQPLDNRRKWIGWIALILFALTFTPAPFQVSF